MGNGSWDWDVKTSTSETTSSAQSTPTHSMKSEETVMGEDMPSVKAQEQTEHHPWDGGFFIIRSRDSPHKVIALINGELQIVDSLPPGGGWLWCCVKKDGWFGFRNTSSGTYLGHDGGGKIIAKVSHHLTYEDFIVERNRGGGYLLLTKHTPMFGRVELWQVGIDKDGKMLTETKNEGTAWEFVDTGPCSTLEEFCRV